MRFLVHGPLSAAVADAVVRHGHIAHRPSELNLFADASASDVLSAAAKSQWEILTADPILATTAIEGAIPFHRCIVYLQLPGGDVEQDDAIDRFFARYPRPGTGKLYTVTTSRVKVRQLPGGRRSAAPVL